MKQASKVNLWMTCIAWALIVLDMFLVLAIGDVNCANVLLFLIVMWLIPTLIGASTWLIIHYRAFFKTWLGWIIPFISLFLSGLAVQASPGIDLGCFASLAVFVFLTSFWGIIPITIIYQRHNDVGLKLIAWGSIIVVWSFVFAWRLQGNLIEALLRNLSPSAPSLQLWWLNPVICIIWWVIPVGIISFLYHTIRLIVHELTN